jgi:PAS domain S-box-containing protein
MTDILRQYTVSENGVFQHVLDSLDELFCVYNKDLQILWTNKKAADSLGMNKDELVGKHCYELWGKQNTPCNDCPVLRALETGETQFLEKQTPDGRYWQLHGSVVYNEDGTVCHLVELGRDVTKKTKTEIALRESEAKLQNLVKSSSEFIWEVDKNGVYTYVSDAAEKLIGFDKNEIIGKTPFDFMESSEANRVGIIFSEIVQKYKRIERLEDTLINKNGELVVFETDGIPLFDNRGDFKGYFGICRDITKRKKIEKSLKESQERFKKLSNLTFEGIVIHNKGTVIDINQSFVNMFGYSRDELIGKNVIQLLIPEKYRSVVKENIHRNYANPYEIKARRKDGTFIPVEIEAKDIKNNNQEFRVAAIREITERKKAESQLKKSNERLKEAEEIGRIGHVDWDVEHDKAFWSDVMFDLYERNPTLGPPSYDEIMSLHVTEDAKRLEKVVNLAITQCEPYEIDLKANLPSGKTAYYHAIGKPVIDDKRKVTNIRGIVQDITERIKFEEKIKSYSMFLDKIIDESPFPMLITD